MCIAWQVSLATFYVILPAQPWTYTDSYTQVDGIGFDIMRPKNSDDCKNFHQGSWFLVFGLPRNAVIGFNPPWYARG